MTDMETRCCVRTCPTNIHQGFLTNRSKKENFCFIAPSIFYFYLFLVYSLWFVSSYPSPFIRLLPGSLPHGKHLRLSATKLSMLVKDIPWLGDWCFKAIVSDSLKAVHREIVPLCFPPNCVAL